MASALAPVPFTPPEQTLPLLESLVSPYTGIVRSTVELLRGQNEVRLASVGCRLCSTDELLGALSVGSTGGINPSLTLARAAAIAEAVERYAGAGDARHSAPLTSAEELDGPVVAPERFTYFLPDQYAIQGFPFVPFTGATRLRFAEALELPTCDPVLVPAQLVYLARPPDDEELIAYPTSNGLACAATFEEAVLAGLLELIERDAFMVTWTNRLSLPLLEWSGDPELERFDRQYLAPAGLRQAAIDASCFFGVPTVFAIAHGRPGDAGLLGIGAAAAPTVQEATRKALAEAYSVQRGARDLALAAGEIPAPGDIRDFDDHLLYYCEPENAQRAAFLAASAARTPAGSVTPVVGDNVQELVEALVALLGRHGVSVFAADVTTPDVREAGLVVVRVLSPELCPLDVIHNARFLGPPRLFRAAHELGLRAAPLTLATANHDPHPFP
jgi:ribosomal protein S12 methylthiotransferase accessory factor